jgi:5-methylcytosine-specific restriction endonuclease McrA
MAAKRVPQTEEQKNARSAKSRAAYSASPELRAKAVESARRRYAEKREECLEAMKKYRSEHPRQQRESDRAYYRLHREEILKRSRPKDRARYAANREELQAKKREYMRARALRNPEEVAAKARAWREANAEKQRLKRVAIYAANREELKEKSRLWKERNPEKAWYKLYPEKKRADGRNRRAKERAAEGRHTAADVAHLLEAQRGICVGCAATLITKGKGKFHVDHIMPIILGGSNWPDNLQLLCPRCNMSKQSKHPDEWARLRSN